MMPLIIGEGSREALSSVNWNVNNEISVDEIQRDEKRFGLCARSSHSCISQSRFIYKSNALLVKDKKLIPSLISHHTKAKRREPILTELRHSKVKNEIMNGSSSRQGLKMELKFPTH